ncbi:hypothetical protein [Streptomyces sp. enrichment culture]|uniref:hypothetical protein n=1 Tax=Streptomyces sp. enrichment culture TaxID=1795815 RepID=UPI003F55AE4E
MSLDWLHEATDGEVIRAWLDEVWARTEAAVILRGGDDGGPLDRRDVLAELYDADALAELRSLTTSGDFLGDRCRCHGHLTVALLDASGEFVGHGSWHGRTDIAWAAFGNNLRVADPAGMIGFLTRHGALGA